MAQYILDTNFFIQSHRSHYPLDVATTFWDRVKSLSGNGTLTSIDKVKKEIYNYHGALKTWCEGNLPKDFFCDTNGVTDHYADLANWAASRSDHFMEKAIADFLSDKTADAWLISYARQHGLTVVTYETSDPKCKNRIKIPDACAPFNVPSCNIVAMFRALGQSF